MMWSRFPITAREIKKKIFGPNLMLRLIEQKRWENQNKKTYSSNIKYRFWNSVSHLDGGDVYIWMWLFRIMESEDIKCHEIRIKKTKIMLFALVMSSLAAHINTRTRKINRFSNRIYFDTLSCSNTLHTHTHTHSGFIENSKCKFVLPSNSDRIFT